jgi:AcrR family transcriptional regulator
MTKPDKVGSRDSAARDRVLDATIQIMLEEGYAAATSRRVAALAGVKPALVHYYFPSMDDLYLAVFRRGAEANLDRQQAALASDRPLRALWETVSEPHGTRLMLEFAGLANHRKEIKAEISAWSERWREMQTTALNFIVRQSGMDAEEFPPAALAVVVAAIGRTLVLEQALGTTGGHEEAVALVNRFIDRYEMPQPFTGGTQRALLDDSHVGRDRQGGVVPNPSIKNEKLYEDLRKEGNSKQKSARIANAAAARGKSAVGRKGGKSGSFDDWTVTDLKKRAKELGLSGYSNLNKDKLISKIRNS